MRLSYILNALIGTLVLLRMKSLTALAYRPDFS